MEDRKSVLLKIYFFTNGLQETVSHKKGESTRPVWSRGIVSLPKKENKAHKMNFNKEGISEHFENIDDISRAVAVVMQKAGVSSVEVVRERNH